jgi:PAS domain S-box-containing protein
MNETAVESQEKPVLDLNEKIRVLLVDDDRSLLKIAKQCLEMEAPLQVDTSLSVEEALKKLEKEKYDVIISDYQMPTKDGLEFLKELRAKDNKIPFIMFTGKGREEVAIKALNLGASQYLNKVGEAETVYAELAHSVTEQAKTRKAEEKQRESEEKFRNLFEKANDGLVFVDVSGRIVDVNQKAVEMAEKRKEDIIGKSFLDLGLVSSKDLLILVEKLKQQTSGKTTERFEFEIQKAAMGYVYHDTLRKKKDGSLIPVSVSAAPISVRDKLIGYVWLYKDISQQKVVEESLKESEERFRGLFAGGPEASVYLSPDFYIQDINRRFEQVFGYSLAEIKGKRLDDVIVQESKKEEAGMLNEKAVGGYVYHETVRRRKDGSFVPVSISAAPIVIKGQLSGTVGTYKDISDLRSAEQKLAVMNEKLRVVGGLTRHDIRNKLSVITGNTYLMKKKLKDHPEVLSSAKEMEFATAAIVELLEFARDYERLGVEELTYVDLEDSVGKAASLFMNNDRTKIANQCHGLIVLADSLLSKLFYNLIDNSLKHGSHVTRIGISCEESEDGLRLVYEDDGVGIAQEAKPKLFSEGYTTGNGTGYGLYLIKKMMEAYGWSIQETGLPGKGARFVIAIPKLNQQGKENYRLTSHRS